MVKVDKYIADLYAEPRISAVDEIIRREEKEELERIISEMPEALQHFMRTFYEADCDRDETCRRLGINRHALRRNVQRLAQFFRERVKFQVGPWRMIVIDLAYIAWTRYRLLERAKNPEPLPTEGGSSPAGT